MSETQFVDPFADDDGASLELLKTFEPTPAPEPNKTKVKAADRVAAEQGFTTRKKKKKPGMRRSKYYETGRSTQIAIKGRVHDKERLQKTCDEQDWVQGQLLEYALDALEEKLKDPENEFWTSRNFTGVD